MSASTCLHLRREEFIELMSNLNLPHPKKIAESVPANMRCGYPEDVGAA